MMLSEASVREKEIVGMMAGYQLGKERFSLVCISRPSFKFRTSTSMTFRELGGRLAGEYHRY